MVYPASILVIKLSHIGDCVTASAAIAALRRRWPRTHITWVVQQPSYEVARANPDVDEVLVYEYRKQAGKALTFLLMLRQRRFDMVVDLQSSTKSTLLSYAARTPLRWPRKNLLGKLIHNYHRRSPSEIKHFSEAFFAPIRALGCKTTLIDRKFAILDEHNAFARTFLEEHGCDNRRPLVGIAPRAAWPSKSLSAKKCVRLCTAIVEELGGNVVLFGSPAEGTFLQQCFGKPQEHIHISAGHTSLKDMGALMQHCAVVIAVDSGPMHIADTLGIPVVALFGPTDERRFRPTGEQAYVIKHNMPCRPCGARHCHCAKERVCLENIAIRDILQITREIVV